MRQCSAVSIQLFFSFRFFFSLSPPRQDRNHPITIPLRLPNECGRRGWAKEPEQRKSPSSSQIKTMALLKLKLELITNVLFRFVLQFSIASLVPKKRKKTKQIRIHLYFVAFYTRLSPDGADADNFLEFMDFCRLVVLFSSLLILMEPRVKEDGSGN